jgi:hypothetical protein
MTMKNISRLFCGAVIYILDKVIFRDVNGGLCLDRYAVKGLSKKNRAFGEVRFLEFKIEK